MNTSGLSLLPQGVYIVWEWECDEANNDYDIDDDCDHVSESSCEDNNPDIQSDHGSEMKKMKTYHQ